MLISSRKSTAEKLPLKIKPDTYRKQVRPRTCFLLYMAFHNDIGINKVFVKVYEMISGQASDGFTILEVTYSIGLAVGIIVFFNHIG